MEKEDFFGSGWGLIDLRNESQSLKRPMNYVHQPRPGRLRLTFSFYSKILGKLCIPSMPKKKKIGDVRRV